MPMIVVDEVEGEVVVFRREAERVFGEKVAVGDAGSARSTGDGAEGGVVVVGGDAVLRGVVEEFGNILVAVVGVEEVEIPVLGAHDERACGDGLGGIPHELGADGVRVGGVQSLDAEEVVVDKAEVRGNLPGTRLLILHAVAKSIEGHSDDGVAGLPADGAVFGVVDDRPNPRLGLDEGLISIRIVLGREVVVGRVGFTFGDSAVANIIVIVGNDIGRD